jgi:bifunctional non-homologous end joining protein LigD
VWSRNGLPLEQKFPAISQSVARLQLRSTVLDGEIIAVDENGIPRFQLLQRFQKQPTAPTVYFIFDALWADGTDITMKTLLERRAVRASIIKPNSGIQLGSFVECEGKALFDLARPSGRTNWQALRPAIDAGGIRSGVDELRKVLLSSNCRRPKFDGIKRISIVQCMAMDSVHELAST